MLAIACCGKNNEIGKNNNLIWNLPSDKKLFKSVTLGSNDGKAAVIMGSKTFESLKAPLSSRFNVVLTSHPEKYNEYLNNPKYDITFVKSMSEALRECIHRRIEYKNLFLIGGEKIYSDHLNLCEMVILTRVDGICEDADRFFPQLGENFVHYSSSEEFSDTDSITGDMMKFHIEVYLNKNYPREVE